MPRRITVVFVASLLLILAANRADAQSALAGVVRDASGECYPGSPSRRPVRP